MKVNEELAIEDKKHAMMKIIIIKKGLAKFTRLNELKKGFESFQTLLEYPDLNFTNVSEEERERALENMESLRRFYLAREAFSNWKDSLRQSPIL